MNSQNEIAVAVELMNIFEDVDKYPVFLDLMSGAHTYFPRTLTGKFIGIGLNEVELQANKRLNGFQTQDINSNPHLTYKDNHFSGVLMNNGIGYVDHPIKLFKEVHRVLKPGASFAVVFDYRAELSVISRYWKKTRSQRERVKLVLSFFAKAGNYKDIKAKRIYDWQGFPIPYFSISAHKAAGKVRSGSSPINPQSEIRFA